MNTIFGVVSRCVISGMLCVLTLFTFTETAGQDSLQGVWESEHRFSQTDATRIAIKQQGDSWFALVGQHQIDLRGMNENQTDIRFEVFKGKGSPLSGQFRGKLNLKKQLISGHWIHPIIGYRSYPVAVPLAFKKAGDTWSATVPKTLERLRLFLCINRNQDGELTAFVRNPERNQGIVWGTCNVVTSINQLKLTNAQRNLVIPCELETNNGETVLTAVFPGWDPKFKFRKIANPEAHESFGPSPESDPYRYRIPNESDDQWGVDSAGNVGMNKQLLEAMVQSIRDSKTDSLYEPYIHSVLVARKGKLVLEEYFYGFDKDHEHDTRSAGKSVGSMIIGTAIDRHTDLSLGRKLSSIFGERFAEPNEEDKNPAWEQRQKWRSMVTIGDALSMSSGLNIDDNGDDSPGSEGLMQDQSQQPDWVQYILDVPMIREPGTQAVYGSNHINLAAAAIAVSTKSWLPDLFHDNLAMPLRIRSYQLNLDPSGNGYMGGGIRLRPRDQLKLGQVMLDRGKWKNKQVLSEEWVRKSLTPAGSINEPNDYCYGWWKKSLPFNGKMVDVWNAGGNGGQFIVFVPELDIVVQISGGNYRNFPVWYRHLTHMIPKYILASVDDDR